MAAVIVASRVDEVSMMVAEILVGSYGFEMISNNIYRRDEVELRIIPEKHIYADGIGEKLNAGLVIVASSHRSEAGIKALLTHPVGNWGNRADLGGVPRTLSMTSAEALYTSLLRLKEATDEYGLNSWRVGLEVTHHGPRTNIPIIFIEAGGPLNEVPERRALEAVASACLKTAELGIKPRAIALGFGGGHYAPVFTRLTLEEDFGFGHMCPKYAMPIDAEMVRQAYMKTAERPRLAVIDWKGVRSEHRRALLPILEELGIEWIKVK